MGPFSIGQSLMFVRWFFEITHMLFHLSRQQEARGFQSKQEYFAYVGTLPR